TMNEAESGADKPMAAAGVVGGLGGGLAGGVFRMGNTNLSGRITDPSGAVVAGAQVQFRAASGAIQNATTDANGLYQMWAPQGLGNITFQSPGFQSTVISNFNVRPGLVTHANARLNVGSTSGTVEVSGEAEPQDFDRLEQYARVQNAPAAPLEPAAESKDLG